MSLSACARLYELEGAHNRIALVRGVQSQTRVLGLSIVLEHIARESGPMRAEAIG